MACTVCGRRSMHDACGHDRTELVDSAPRTIGVRREVTMGIVEILLLVACALYLFGDGAGRPGE